MKGKNRDSTLGAKRLPATRDQSLVAAKTLSGVEVDGDKSHQHEFHAGRLRQVLRFPKARVEGRLTVLSYHSDGLEPHVQEDGFTLYDAREASPRRTEWRLYYKAGTIQRFAREGDLLVICRPSTVSSHLYAIVARAGTRQERVLRDALQLGDVDTIAQFIAAEGDREALEAAVLEEETRSWLLDRGVGVESHPLYRRAVRSQTLPSTMEMAEAAREIVISEYPTSLSPDDFLVALLDVESQLFYAVEEAVSEVPIKRLFGEPGSVPRLKDVLAFATSRLQARKSRRGRSLENHVATLLRSCNIPFSQQCRTEPGCRPDFVVPSCADYHNPEFPAERLRMIGCKSRIRERWRQYLSEARRVQVKYHVTVDEDLTGDVIREMHGQNLRVYMPAKLISESYSGNAAAELIGTVEDLINDLRAAIVGSHGTCRQSRNS